MKIAYRTRIKVFSEPISFADPDRALYKLQDTANEWLAFMDGKHNFHVDSVQYHYAHDSYSVCICYSETYKVSD